jgi:hypothetical protein
MAIVVVFERTASMAQLGEHVSKESFKDRFDLGEVLGSGTFSVVKVRRRARGVPAGRRQRQSEFAVALLAGFQSVGLALALSARGRLPKRMIRDIGKFGAQEALDRRTQTRVAVKVIMKKALAGEDLRLLVREVRARRLVAANR